MRFLFDSKSCYIVAGPVFHKCLEVGVQRQTDNQGIDVCWRFTTRGDHAGMKFVVTLWRALFEFNVYDHRHWNWNTNTFVTARE